MREATLILPIADNSGKPLAKVHDRLSQVLCDTFGGFTAAPVRGAWKDTESGKVYSDESTEYRIAADWNPVERQTLEDIAREFGDLAGQLAVFVKHGNGAVSILPSASAAQIRAERPAPLVSRRRLAEQYGRAPAYATA